MYRMIPPRHLQQFEQEVMKYYLIAVPQDSWVETNKHRLANPVPELVMDIVLKVSNFYVIGVLWKEYDNDNYMDDITSGLHPDYQAQLRDQYVRQAMTTPDENYRKWFFEDVLWCLEKFQMQYWVRHMNDEINPWNVEADIVGESYHNSAYIRVW